MAAHLSLNAGVEVQLALVQLALAAGAKVQLVLALTLMRPFCDT